MPTEQKSQRTLPPLTVNNKRLLCYGVGLLLLVLTVVVLSYGSGLLFFKLNQMPLELVRPFTIWDYFNQYKDSPYKFVRITVVLCTITPYILIALALVGFLIQHQSKRSLHGDARFATLSEIKQAGLIDPPNGLEKTILVGKYKNHYLTFGGYQFVMLAAPTRSGKGVGVVIPNCLNYSDSLVVLDIKLENYEASAGFRAKHGQEVYLFAPFDRNSITHRYNPLSYISSDPAERLGDIDAIAAALYTSNDIDSFWNECAKDLFRGLCLLVLETPSLPKTLGEILRQASGKGKQLRTHLKDMLKEHTYSSACVDTLNRSLGYSDNTLSSIVATFNAPLLIFQNPRVDMATSDNDFDLRDVRRKKMSIYLGITPDKLADARMLVNLFFDQLLNLNTRVLPSQDPSLKYQCLLILDEFTSIGKVHMIQQAISYQSGYNMRVLTIIQNKSQLEEKYGRAGAVTLMANHALMIMFAPSPVLQSDANEYSEMLGYQTVKNTNTSRSFNNTMAIGSNKTSRSENISDQKRALMLPQEIKELGKDREIVSLENCKPIFCDKIKYYSDPIFIKRCNWEKPHIKPLDIHTFMQANGLINATTDTQDNTDDAVSAAPTTAKTTEPTDLKAVAQAALGDGAELTMTTGTINAAALNLATAAVTGVSANASTTSSIGTAGAVSAAGTASTTASASLDGDLDELLEYFNDDPAAKTNTPSEEDIKDALLSLDADEYHKQAPVPVMATAAPTTFPSEATPAMTTEVVTVSEQLDPTVTPPHDLEVTPSDAEQLARTDAISTDITALTTVELPEPTLDDCNSEQDDFFTETTATSTNEEPASAKTKRAVRKHKDSQSTPDEHLAVSALTTGTTCAVSAQSDSAAAECPNAADVSAVSPDAQQLANATTTATHTAAVGTVEPSQPSLKEHDSKLNALPHKHNSASTDTTPEPPAASVNEDSEVNTDAIDASEILVPQTEKKKRVVRSRKRKQSSTSEPAAIPATQGSESAENASLDAVVTPLVTEVDGSAPVALGATPTQPVTDAASTAITVDLGSDAPAAPVRKARRRTRASATDKAATTTTKRRRRATSAASGGSDTETTVSSATETSTAAPATSPVPVAAVTSQAASEPSLEERYSKLEAFIRKYSH